MAKVEIPKYTLAEELISSISHGIGALLGIAALVLSVVFSHKPISIVSSSIYGASLIILYTISCLYHSFSPKIGAKKVFRILDHACIYLLIFGTYMPYLLVLIGGAKGWTLWGILLGLSVIGIILNAINLEKFKTISLISYILMGWIIIFSFNDVKTLLGFTGTLYLILGGLFYTVGALIYKFCKNIKYMHSLFHFFVLAGSIFHFFSIFLYVIR